MWIVPTCLRNKRAYKKKEPLVPVKIKASRPRSVVAFDLAVLPCSSQGYRYTLVAVDLFSKFLEAWPLKEKDTTSVIDGLENAWFNRHGLPDLLLSDQENAVDGQMMRDMCRRYGIRKSTHQRITRKVTAIQRDLLNHLKRCCDVY